MHESGTKIEPDTPADWLEWGFRPGDPALVAALPAEDGETTLIRLDMTSPISLREREFARTLLLIAQHQLDKTEPTQATGARP